VLRPLRAEIAEGLRVEGLGLVVVDAGEVAEDARTEHCGPDREDLRLLVGVVFKSASLQLTQILRSQQAVVGEILKVKGAGEAGQLIGPRVLRGYLGLALLIDEHVFRLDIAYLLDPSGDVVLGGSEGVQDVPKLAFLEGAAVRLSLADEFSEGVGVVGVGVLRGGRGTVRVPEFPQSPWSCL
jgi:hypothetical protein